MHTQVGIDHLVLIQCRKCDVSAYTHYVKCLLLHGYSHTHTHTHTPHTRCRNISVLQSCLSKITLIREKDLDRARRYYEMLYLNHEVHYMVPILYTCIIHIQCKVVSALSLCMYIYKSATNHIFTLYYHVLLCMYPCMFTYNIIII